MTSQEWNPWSNCKMRRSEAAMCDVADSVRVSAHMSRVLASPSLPSLGDNQSHARGLVRICRHRLFAIDLHWPCSHRFHLVLYFHFYIKYPGNRTGHTWPWYHGTRLHGKSTGRTGRASRTAEWFKWKGCFDDQINLPKAKYLGAKDSILSFYQY